MRFEKPILGLKDAATISVFSPCQVFVSFFDEEDHYRPEQSFSVFTMSSFDPHTTVLTSRSCRDCHSDPKSLGIGDGRLFRREKRWHFRPTYDVDSSGLDIPFAMDAFVNLEGNALHATSRKAARPFNKKELDKILSVDGCVGCHNRYEDPIYKDFQVSKRRFERDKSLPCGR